MASSYPEFFDNFKRSWSRLIKLSMVYLIGNSFFRKEEIPKIYQVLFAFKSSVENSVVFAAKCLVLTRILTIMMYFFAKVFPFLLNVLMFNFEKKF